MDDYKKFVNKVKLANKGYNFYEGKEDHIVKGNEIISLESGCLAIFGSLKIEKGGLIKFTGDLDWWTKEKKWCIIAVQNDIVLGGRIEAIDWRFPNQNIETNEIFYPDSKSNDNNFPISYSYIFGLGGKGANGSKVRAVRNNSYTEQVRGGYGASGSIEHGGGGGSGAGYNPDNHFAHEGADADGVKGGNDIKASFPGKNGASGGYGGKTPDKGVGGLVLIWGQGVFKLLYDIIDHIYIDVHGKRGNDGYDGSNSSDTNNGRVGCGGGGAGSSGLPAGAIIIRNFHLVQISKSNCNLFSGEPGNNGSNGKIRYCSDVGILDEVEPIAAKILPNGFFDK